MSAQSCGDERGIVTGASAYTAVSETPERLQRIVREHGASIVVSDLSELLEER